MTTRCIILYVLIAIESMVLLRRTDRFGDRTYPMPPSVLFIGGILWPIIWAGLALGIVWAALMHVVEWMGDN
jgi:hypothetical protein